MAPGTLKSNEGDVYKEKTSDIRELEETS